MFALPVLAVLIVAPALAQTGPKFGRSGSVGSADSTMSGGEPTGGTFTVSGQTGQAALSGVAATSTTSPLPTDAYGQGSASGKTSSKYSASDNSDTTGLERYTLYAEQKSSGTGDPQVLGSTFAIGGINIKSNWQNTTRRGQTIGGQFISRGGYNGSDKTTPIAGFDYNPAGDTTSILANGVVSSDYSQGAILEGVQFYAPLGAFDPALYKSVNVQLGPMRQKNADGSTANLGIGVAATASHGTLGSAFTAYNGGTGDWQKFVSFGHDGVERFAISGAGDITGKAVTLVAPLAIDLTYGTTAPGNVMKMGAGNTIAYCPQLSCVPVTTGGVVHRAASALLSTTTAYDAQAEEDTLALYTVVDKGFARALNRSTAYSVGEAAFIGNAVYRATTAGTTASGSPPSGSRPVSFPYSITDGGVTWLWINDYAVVAKTAFYNEVINKAGGGQSWAQANNYELAAGLTPTFNINTELDFANRSGTDCDLGVSNCIGLYIRMIGANKNTAGISLESNEAGSIFGLRATGPYFSSVVSLDATAPRGIGLGTLTGATYSVAAIDDISSAPVGLNVTGTKANAGVRLAGTAPTGLLLQGTFTNQITGTGFNVSSGGDVNTQSLVVGGNIYLLSPLVPPTSTTPCAKGQLSYDSGFMYVCVATNSWKRSTLVDF